MREVQRLQNVNHILDHYSNKYLERYNRRPMDFIPNDSGIIEYILKRCNNDVELACQIVDTYLSLNGQKRDDNWFCENGHDLPTMKNKLAFLFAATANSGSKENEVLYIIGISEKGHPVVGKEPRSCIKGFVPISVAKWNALPLDKKFMIAEALWIKLGIDTIAWRQNWSAWFASL